MPLRLVQMVCPVEERDEAVELVGEHEPIGLWQNQLVDGHVLVTFLLPAERAEDVLDQLDERFSTLEGFRIVLLPVAATIPRPQKDGKEAAEPEKEEEEKQRISRQELYDDIAGPAEFSASYLVMIVLSSLVAAVGVWKGNVAVIIGAMVITPMLGPNMALALGSTLGDGELLRRALKTNFLGICAALGLSVVMGMLMPLGAEGQQTFWGAEVGLSDIAVALAAGGAGALAVTRGTRTALVGVMVAVALLPPLVSFGLALGAALWAMAIGAGLLFLANLICINLAAIATFMLQGIHPRRYYEAEEARRSARRALMLWVVLLLALAAAIVIGQGKLRQIVLAHSPVHGRCHATAPAATDGRPARWRCG